MSSWVALDWGTTNFRAYLMDNNDIVDQISTQEGMKFANQKDFEKWVCFRIEEIISIIKQSWVLQIELVTSPAGSILSHPQLHSRSEILVHGQTKSNIHKPKFLHLIERSIR